MINMIAASLKENGFKVEVKRSSVIVSLNRKISNMEVKMALDTEYDGIEFTTSTNNGKVEVSL